MEAFAIERVKALFGVSTLSDLGKMSKSDGGKVNAKLLAQVAAKMQALDKGQFLQ